MQPPLTGFEIRQSFIDFFISKGHTFVPSSSLVPGGDQTLLFTNAGMVQFKDVFLGIDKRPYTRAVNSQKCMRVAGKHNDLDDVGRDNSHHTFFEMLGNWSFGDYYKKEAISWAWELLTEHWGLEKGQLWATCFKDDKGDIPSDEEAASYWREQPGMDSDHVLYFGRKDNFWEMADVGPCGPCSEIHIDLGIDFCDLRDKPGHVCRVNGDCKRFLELWNLVFIQYNRLGPTVFEPLPARHVDTGMGLDRIVSVLQKTFSNYKTDLLLPLIKTVQKESSDSDAGVEEHFTPFRVVADHARAATFLIADGVVPGNMGRNYVCRMIIRRAALYGSKIGLNEPFLAKVAETVIENYGSAYPELVRNQPAILQSLSREERRFKQTVDIGLHHLDEILDDLKKNDQNTLDGQSAFNLYATHGLPLEITRDIAREVGIIVDENGFREAIEEHRLVSGTRKMFGPQGGEKAAVYRMVLENLMDDGKVGEEGVIHDPYSALDMSGELLAIVKDFAVVPSANENDLVEIIIGKTPFYVQSGGQVSDTGKISALDGSWQVEIEDVYRPAAGVIVHKGKVISGCPKVGQAVLVSVNASRRKDIMRNHSATHLLHAELHKILGEHARQAGSLVAPDRLRFDFNHSEAISNEDLEKIETGVNQGILGNFVLDIQTQKLSDAVSNGAMALFGEKYGEIVRTVTIGSKERVSFELCGGTHVESTGDIGTFLILGESSAAAGIRRIEAVTGRAAYQILQKRLRILRKASSLLTTSIDEIPEKISLLLEDLDQNQKANASLKQKLVGLEFSSKLEGINTTSGISFLCTVLKDADPDTLRQMTDHFRDKYPSGIVLLGSIFESRPIFVCSISADLVAAGFHAGNLLSQVARVTGGGGGGKPNMAQAGGKDANKLEEAIEAAKRIIETQLNTTK